MASLRWTNQARVVVPVVLGITFASSTARAQFPSWVSNAANNVSNSVSRAVGNPFPMHQTYSTFNDPTSPQRPSPVYSGNSPWVGPQLPITTRPASFPPQSAPIYNPVAYTPPTYTPATDTPPASIEPQESGGAALGNLIGDVIQLAVSQDN